MTLDTLQAKFAHFARHAVTDDPLYVALTGAAAQRPGWAGLLAEAPEPLRSPTLWLAALQDRVLELVDAGTRPALADWYPSVGPAHAPDAALIAEADAFIARERDALVARLRTRQTQTNEIGRCAVLWPVLQSLAQSTGRDRIALLDVGSSAGLNLGVDHWRYRYVDDANDTTLASAADDRDPRAPEIVTRVLAGPRHAHAGEPRLVARLGIDLHPVAVDDTAAVRWLRACLWPGDRVRRARFDAAVKIAREQRWPVRACADAADGVAEWLAALPRDVLPVIFNSWVLAYFDGASLRRYVDTVLAAVAGRGAAWISAEDPRQSRTWWPDMPEAASTARPNATAWTLATPDGRGGVAWRLAATSHAHGTWVEWGGREG